MRPEPDYSVWLYGSHSRGTVDEFSDVDVLLVSASGTDDAVVYDLFEQVPKLSISRYSWHEVEEMAAYGSLFLRHVALEGRMVFETVRASGRLASVLRGLGPYQRARRDLAGFRTVLRDVTESLADGHASLVFETSTLAALFRHACILSCAVEGGFCFSREEPVERAVRTLDLPENWVREFSVFYRYRLYAEGRAPRGQDLSLEFLWGWCGRTRRLLDVLEERILE